jgi:hypothetical protein
MSDTTVRKLVPQPEFDTVVTRGNAGRDDIKNSPGLVHEDLNIAVIAVANAVDLATSIALANQLQTTMNAHAADAGAHVNADATNFPDATAVASDLATTQTLLNNLKTKWNAHVIAGRKLKKAIAQGSAATVPLSPPALAINSARVTGGAAAAGNRQVTDSGGTPSATVATISDDGATLTFEAGVTGVTVVYEPVNNTGVIHNSADIANQVATANASDQTTSNALANALKVAVNAHLAAGFSSTKIVRGPA